MTMKREIDKPKFRKFIQERLNMTDEEFKNAPTKDIYKRLINETQIS